MMEYNKLGFGIGDIVIAEADERKICIITAIFGEGDYIHTIHVNDSTETTHVCTPGEIKCVVVRRNNESWNPKYVNPIEVFSRLKSMGQIFTKLKTMPLSELVGFVDAVDKALGSELELANGVLQD